MQEKDVMGAEFTITVQFHNKSSIERISICCSANQTILDIKLNLIDKLADKIDCDINSIDLVCMGNILEDRKKLSFYRFGEATTLHMLINSPNPVNSSSYCR